MLRRPSQNLSKFSKTIRSAFEWCKRTLPDDTRWKVLGLMQGGCALSTKAHLQQKGVQFQNLSVILFCFGRGAKCRLLGSYKGVRGIETFRSKDLGATQDNFGFSIFT
jgi:hypothetical protein